MSGHLTDRGVREALGLSQQAAATFAGCTKNTLALYEAAPHVVRADKAEACAALYKLLREHLTSLERLRKARHG